LQPRRATQSDRPTGGNELLAYRDGKQWVDVRSEDINEFVKELSGGEFTAKDFRTWAGTVLAAVALAVSEGAATKTARKRAKSPGRIRRWRTTWGIPRPSAATPTSIPGSSTVTGQA
jgi:DNA topoisomerase IB